jgi:thioredoxin 2
MISETEGTTEGRPSYEDCPERPFHARGAQVRVADEAGIRRKAFCLGLIDLKGNHLGIRYRFIHGAWAVAHVGSSFGIHVQAGAKGGRRMSVKLVCLACGQGNRVPEDRLDARPKCGTCGAGLVTDTPVEVSLDVLKKAERTDDLPLVVDFWAAWCGPCRMMAPEFAKAAKVLEGRARFVKLDTEAFPEAGSRYGIRGIPLLVAFRRGRETGRHAGAIPARDIVDWVSAGARV